MTKPKPSVPLSRATMRRLMGLQRAIQTGKPYRMRPEIGFAYVIGYDSGIVKVGSTANPGERFPTLKRQALAHGKQILDARLSWIHEGYVDTERQLIAFCREHGQPQGREHFLIPFAEVADFALTISYFDIEAYKAKYCEMTERLALLQQSVEIARRGANGDLSMNLLEAYQRGLAMTDSS